MRKLNRTILGWVLAVFLGGLPISASADISSYSVGAYPCLEMNMVESMAKTCCDQISNVCACEKISACNSGNSHVTLLMITNPNFTPLIELTQFMLEPPVQYLSLIFIANIRPPII